jgi:ABC-type branched-subunit amino acid transport system ATPase component
MSIEVSNVAVRFGGVTALEGVSLTLNPGEILGVIGPNGSGKSTLFNAITGFASVADGEVSVDGQNLAGIDAYKRVSNGISRTFQTPRIDPKASVEEAVLSGFHPRAMTSLWGGLFRPRSVQKSEEDLRRQRLQLLADLNLSSVAQQPLSELPMGLVRLVDIARAMAAGPKYLLLDEPAAGLSRAEQKVLVDQVRRVADQGVGVLLVEHNFRLVKSLATRVVVLNRGKVLLRGTPEEVSQRPEFVGAYLGASAY